MNCRSLAVHQQIAMAASGTNEAPISVDSDTEEDEPQPKRHQLDHTSAGRDRGSVSNNLLAALRREREARHGVPQAIEKPEGNASSANAALGFAGSPALSARAA